MQVGDVIEYKAPNGQSYNALVQDLDEVERRIRIIYIDNGQVRAATSLPGLEQWVDVLVCSRCGRISVPKRPLDD